MSGDRLDLDAIEHEAKRLGGLFDSVTVLALVAEVRRLRDPMLAGDWTDDEPCLCDTGFTCLARHDDAGVSR